MKRVYSQVDQVITRSVKRRKWLANVPTAPVYLTPQQVVDDYEATVDALHKGFVDMKRNSTHLIRDYSLLMTQANNHIYPIMLAEMISPLQEVRKACSEVIERWPKDILKVSTDHELYLLMEKTEPGDDEEEKLKDSFILGLKTVGAHYKSLRKRDEIRKVHETIGVLEAQFGKNYNENVEHIYFTSRQLKGCPKEFLERTYDKKRRNHKIMFKRPDIAPIMENCSVPLTRKRLFIASRKKCVKENRPVFKQLRLEREKLAKLMGCDTFTRFNVKHTMAKTPEKINKFLNDLMVTLQPVSDEEIGKLCVLKNFEERSTKLEMWDHPYYLEKYRKQNYSVDQNEIKNYFPTEVCYPKIMEFYEDILGLRFEEIKLDDNKKWHPSVRYFATYDQRTNEVIGYFYLDMYPRDGKYAHACCSSMRTGTKDGETIGLLIMNCDDKMDFYTVETFFHEFGHVMHQICSGYLCNYQELNWESVTTDFVEAPSQMMENWCYEPEVIARVSSHYITGEPMPTELVNKMSSVRKVGQAYEWLRICIDALCDMKAHNHPHMSLDGWQMYRGKIQGEWLYMGEPSSCAYYAAWCHLGDGEYAAKYWSYVWAKVIAADLYTPFQRQGVTSKEVGQRYRNLILAPGGSEHEEDMVENFLGRKFNVKAFVDSVSY
jgi:Zn-dependent oligopeptidase